MEVCRALVPLGLSPLAGLARRPVFLTGEHADRALRSLVADMGGPWRKVLAGGLGARGDKAAGSSKRAADWGEEAEPDYGSRPPAVWRKGAKPAAAATRQRGASEIPRRKRASALETTIEKENQTKIRTKRGGEANRHQMGTGRLSSQVTGAGVPAVREEPPAAGSLSARGTRPPVASGGAVQPPAGGCGNRVGAPVVVWGSAGGPAAARGKKRGRAAPASPE